MSETRARRTATSRSTAARRVVDFADFLIGAPVGYNQCSQQFLDSRSRYGGAFFQDVVQGQAESHIEPWAAVGSEHAVVRHAGEDRDHRARACSPPCSRQRRQAGWCPGDPGIPRTLAPTDYNNFAPRVGIAYSPGFQDGVLGKVFGGPGKTSIRASFGMYYTSIEDLNLFYEVGDAPFGLYWVSPEPTMFDEPFRTRSTGASQTQRFPFQFPIPGDRRTRRSTTRFTCRSLIRRVTPSTTDCRTRSTTTSLCNGRLPAQPC